MIGKTISQYKILEKLGEGGMGVVYKAEDTKLERTVALKFLPHQIAASDEQHERFKTEAKAAAALNHPNITTIYNIEEVDDEIFIVMEYIEGKELREIVGANSRSPLPMDEILTYADQIAQGLQAAHDKGIVHRDIKSSNVMVTEKGQVKIMDFGVAKFAGVAGPTTHGSTIGTMGYMSPEQIQGQTVDHRSDLWSFGVLFYEMLTGQLPFTGEYEAAIIYEILSEEPKAIQLYRQDVPNNITALVSRLLQRELGKRVSSAKEIIENLDVKTAKETPEDDKKSLKAGWIKWAAMVPAIIAIGILAVQFFSPKKQVPQDIGAIPGMTDNSSPLPRVPRKSKPTDPSPNQATTAKTEMSRAKKVATTVSADRLAIESLAASELNKNATLRLLSQEQLTDTIDVFKETGQLPHAPARETNVSSEDYATEAKALQDSLRRIKTTLNDEYIFLAEYKEAAEVERSGDALFESGDHIGAIQSYQKAAPLYEAITRMRERQVGQVQAVIETYERALKNKDLRLLKSLYVDFTQKMQTEWDRVFKATDDIEAQLSIEGLAFQQEKVTASVDARLKYSGFVDSDNRFMWQIQLIETSSGWLIADISQNK